MVDIEIKGTGDPIDIPHFETGCGRGRKRHYVLRRELKLGERGHGLRPADHFHLDDRRYP